jgi:hypothetical protein
LETLALLHWAGSQGRWAGRRHRGSRQGPDAGTAVRWTAGAGGPRLRLDAGTAMRWIGRPGRIDAGTAVRSVSGGGG